MIFPDHDGLLAAIRSRLSTSRPDTAAVAVSEAARWRAQHYLAEGERARERYALTRTVPALRDRERAGMQQYERLFAEFIHDWLGGAPETALRAQLLANAVVTAHNHVLRRWLRREIEDPQVAFDTAMAEVSTLFDVTPQRGRLSLRHDRGPASQRQGPRGAAHEDRAPAMTYDDMGTPFTPRRPASRVVSLVPSLTESIASHPPRGAGRRDRLVHAPGGPRRRPGPRHQEPGPRARSRTCAPTWSSPTRRRTASSTSADCARPGSRSGSP